MSDGHVPPGGVAPSEHMLPGGVAPGDSDALRHVETDVLIPKKMRSKSMKLCADYVKVFEDCVRGRTVTMVWACREESKRMKECLASYYKNEEFYEECKKEYLAERKEFRTTGVRKNTKRASS